MNLLQKIASTIRSTSRIKIVIISAVIVPLVIATGVGAYLNNNLRFVDGKLVRASSSDVNDGTESGAAIANSAQGSDQKKAAGSTDKKSTSTQQNKSSTGSGSASSGQTSSSGGSTSSTSSDQTTPWQSKFGMSAPSNKWTERLGQVGATNVKYRRLFFQSFTDNISKVDEALDAGMTPVISWKAGSYSWAQVASGAADAQLYSLVGQLNAIPGPKFLAIHHEPAGDGTAADYVAMQLHALPILKTAQQSTVGVIGNGWWWSAQNQGYSDSEIAEWIPSSVKNVSDVIAADTYQDEGLVEDGSVKASRLAAWAKRTGGVSALGIGEFNGFTASSITNVMNVVKAEPLFKWALVWNSGPSGLGTPLEGDRLQAFILGKSTGNPT